MDFTKRRRIWTVVVVLVGYLAFLGASAVETTDCWNGWSVMGSLHEIAVAEEEFRRVGADRNGAHDYWREDVAGLYTLAPDGTPLRYITPTTALADRRPRTAAPGAASSHYGYWYQTLGFQGERPSDRTRFAFCASPDPREGATWVFVVRNGGDVYAKELDPPTPPEFCPADPGKEGWLTRDQVRKVRWKRRNALWWVRFWEAI